MNFTNSLLAASGQNHPTKMDAIIHWITDHMSLAGKHWSPGGFGEGPHIFSNNFTTQSFFLIIATVITFILFGILYNKKQKTPTGITNPLKHK
jgi:hypothetical protein